MLGDSSRVAAWTDVMDDIEGWYNRSRPVCRRRTTSTAHTKPPNLRQGTLGRLTKINDDPVSKLDERRESVKNNCIRLETR